MVRGAKRVARQKAAWDRGVSGAELFKYGVLVPGETDNDGPQIAPEYQIEKYKGVGLDKLLEIAKGQAKK